MVMAPSYFAATPYFQRVAAEYLMGNLNCYGRA